MVKSGNTRSTSRRERAPRPPPRPLDDVALRDAALRYVGRYATTAAKLRQFLARKLRERGWQGDDLPDLDALAARFVELGYIDDRAFGESRSRGLAARGYGPRRVAQALTAAGIDRDDVAAISGGVDAHAAALRYAERRRFGPFDPAGGDPERRRKQFAAMLRAGHRADIVKRVLAGEGAD